MDMTLVPCFVCGKEMERVESDHPMQSLHGVVCESHGNYGSSVLDGDHVEFLVCDDCFQERRDKVRLVVVHTPRPTVDYSEWRAQ